MDEQINNQYSQACLLLNGIMVSNPENLCIEIQQNLDYPNYMGDIQLVRINGRFGQMGLLPKQTQGGYLVGDNWPIGCLMIYYLFICCGCNIKSETWAISLQARVIFILLNLILNFNKYFYDSVFGRRNVMNSSDYHMTRYLSYKLMHRLREKKVFTSFYCK